MPLAGSPYQDPIDAMTVDLEHLEARAIRPDHVAGLCHTPELLDDETRRRIRRHIGQIEGQRVAQIGDRRTAVDHHGTVGSTVEEAARRRELIAHRSSPKRRASCRSDRGDNRRRPLRR